MQKWRGLERHECIAQSAKAEAFYQVSLNTKNCPLQTQVEPGRFQFSSSWNRFWLKVSSERSIELNDIQYRIGGALQSSSSILNIQYSYANSISKMKAKLFFHFFLFLFGFVSGNLFPTFCGEFSSFFLLLFLESLNFLFLLEKLPFSGTGAQSYESRSPEQAKGSWTSQNGSGRTVRIESEDGRSPFSYRTRIFGLNVRQTRNSSNSKMQPTVYLNSIKIGFLFGLFVDAFKVGS